MHMLRFRDWGLQSKILSFFLAAVVLVLLGLLGYFLPVVGDSLMQEKRTATKGVVEVAYGVIDYWGKKAESGAMTTEAAQEAAKAEIATFRYEGNEYFWINDMKQVIIVHGVKPELNGKDLTDMKDENGVYLFQEMVKVSREKGQGSSTTTGPSPALPRPSPRSPTSSSTSRGAGSWAAASTLTTWMPRWPPCVGRSSFPPWWPWAFSSLSSCSCCVPSPVPSVRPWKSPTAWPTAI